MILARQLHQTKLQDPVPLSLDRMVKKVNYWLEVHAVEKGFASASDVHVDIVTIDDKGDLKDLRVELSDLGVSLYESDRSESRIGANQGEEIVELIEEDASVEEELQLKIRSKSLSFDPIVTSMLLEFPSMISIALLRS